MSAADINAQDDQDGAEVSFEQALQTVESTLQELKARYAQVQTDQHRQGELWEQRQHLLNAAQSKTTKAELEHIETELQELELRLESRLFSWDSWKQYFWQTVRFVGIGMALGWGLAFYVMKQPLPPQIEPNRPEHIR
jgi:hypothetical protein